MRYSYSPEQDFSDWDTERLERYSNDLAGFSDDWRNRHIKKRIDAMLKTRPEDELWWIDWLL